MKKHLATLLAILMLVAALPLNTAYAQVPAETCKDKAALEAEFKEAAAELFENIANKEGLYKGKYDAEKQTVYVEILDDQKLGMNIAGTGLIAKTIELYNDYGLVEIQFGDTKIVEAEDEDGFPDNILMYVDLKGLNEAYPDERQFSQQIKGNVAVALISALQHKYPELATVSGGVGPNHESNITTKKLIDKSLDIYFTLGQEGCEEETTLKYTVMGLKSLDDIPEPEVPEPEVPEPEEPEVPEKPEEPHAPQWMPGFFIPVTNEEKKPEEEKPEEEEKPVGEILHAPFIEGYPDGTVKPEGKITRAEAATMIARLVGLDLTDTTAPAFDDTNQNWYYAAINAMVKKELMFAKDGKFRPDEPITRGEFARAIYGLKGALEAVAPFEDVKGHEFEAAINEAFGHGYINGYPDGSFQPDGEITRAEAAKILNRVDERAVNQGGLAEVNFESPFTDLKNDHWAYYELLEAALGHSSNRVEGQTHENWVTIEK